LSNCITQQNNTLFSVSVVLITTNLISPKCFQFVDKFSTTTNTAEVVEFLRQLPADDLVRLGDEFYAVIDGRILPSSPQDVYTTATHNHVQLMLGCNSDEGELILTSLASKFGINPDSLDIATVGVVIATFVSMTIAAAHPNAKQITDAVVAQYLSGFDSTASSQELHKILVDFLTDSMFVIPTIRTANSHSRMCTNRHIDTLRQCAFIS